jgi:phosphoglycolate phosphatase-like HAD superfamily hydrolase
VNAGKGARAEGTTQVTSPIPAANFVARWDLDKTYLRTDFDTLPDLVRTAFERPDQKRAVPGATALLAALGQTGARIHILSGSPRQMRRRLEDKLRLDRVRWDELTLKPNLSNVLRLRLRALRDQLGYKLPALLSARVRDQAGASGSGPSEVLVGDDAEADAFVYSLYADICEGLVEAPELRKILKAGQVYADQREACLGSFEQVRRGPSSVERILIHLDRQSPPSNFDAFRPRVVPFYNYLQAAFVLAEDGRLEGNAVLDVASVMMVRHGFDPEALGRSYLDLLRRGHARGSIGALLRDGLAAGGGGREPKTRESLREMCDLVDRHVQSMGPIREPRPEGPRRDYVELASRHRGGRNRKRFPLVKSYRPS